MEKQVEKKSGAPIEWPKITVGPENDRREFTLRWSYTANWKLARWGLNLASADYMSGAAAMAGHFDERGQWHSETFKQPEEFCDLMVYTDAHHVIDAVNEAIKKAQPDSGDPKTTPTQKPATKEDETGKSAEQAEQAQTT